MNDKFDVKNNERVCDILEDLSILSMHAKNCTEILIDTESEDLSLPRYADLIHVIHDYLYELDTKLNAVIENIDCSVKFIQKKRK